MAGHFLKSLAFFGRWTFRHVDDIPCQGDLRSWLSRDLGTLEHEECVILLFDPDGHPLGELRIEGEYSRVAWSELGMFRAAIYFGASLLIVAHNHPSGMCNASEADYDTCRRLAQSANILGMKVHDFWIFAGDEIYSFRDSGLI